MKSNKCLFSKTVFKSNVLRFLPFAAPLLIAELIAFPLALYNSDPKFTLETFSYTSLASDIISMIFAGLFGILVFSYLFKPNACNAFHAFPIGRKALFVTGFVSAYTLLVVPQLIGLAAGIPVITRMGTAPAQFITLGFVSIFGVSFIALATAVLAVMLAGNLFASVVLYGIVNFIYIAAVSILKAAVMGFGVGLSNVSIVPDNSYLSPLASLVLSKISLGNSIAGALLTEQKTNLADYYKLLIIYVVAAVAVLAVSYLLYKIRKLEVAGDMVSFKAEIPVISIIAAVFGGAFFTALLGSIFSFGNVSIIISYIIFTLLCYFGAQMILRKKAKVFGVKNFIIWALTAVITLGATLGIAMYETYLVPAKNIKSIEVGTDYDFEVDREEFTTVYDLHQALIKNELKGKTPVQLILGSTNTDEKLEYSYDTEDSYVPSYCVNLTYTLTNGKLVERNYTVIQGTKEVDALVDKLEEKHHAKTVFDWMDEVDYTLKGCTIEDYSSEDENGDYKTVTLSKEDAEKLYALCKADIDSRKVHISTTAREEEDGIADDFNTSFTFTVKDMDSYHKLKGEPYISDFSSASIDNYSYTGFEPEDLSKEEFVLNIGTLTKGGAADNFIKEKLNNK